MTRNRKAPASTGSQTRPSAFHQIAKGLLNAIAFMGVVLLGDRPGLTAQFKAKQDVLQLIKAAADFAVKICRGTRGAQTVGGRSTRVRGACLNCGRRSCWPDVNCGRVCQGRCLRLARKENQPQQEQCDEASDKNPLQAV